MAKVSKKGQWKYPGEDTIIPNANGSITMKGVPYPVLGIDDLGNQQIMIPGMDYQFPGNSVYEIPYLKNDYGFDATNIPSQWKPVAWPTDANNGKSQVGHYTNPKFFKDGGDISVPDLKRVKINSLPKAQKGTEVATAADSSFIAQHANEVENFYKKNGYKLLQTGSNKGVFETLAQARNEFKNVAGDFYPLTTDENPLSYKDYTNYTPNANRFEQYEPTYGMVNTNAPRQIYDTRILPQYIKVYEDDSYDVAELPIYDKLAVTPWKELTQEQQIKRLKKFGVSGTPYTNQSVKEAIKSLTAPKPMTPIDVKPFAQPGPVIEEQPLTSYFQPKPRRFRYVDSSITSPEDAHYWEKSVDTDATVRQREAKKRFELRQKQQQEQNSKASFAYGGTLFKAQIGTEIQPTYETVKVTDPNDPKYQEYLYLQNLYNWSNLPDFDQRYRMNDANYFYSHANNASPTKYNEDSLYLNDPKYLKYNPKSYDTNYTSDDFGVLNSKASKVKFTTENELKAWMKKNKNLHPFFKERINNSWDKEEKVNWDNILKTYPPVGYEGFIDYEDPGIAHWFATTYNPNTNQQVYTKPKTSVIEDKINRALLKKVYPELSDELIDAFIKDERTIPTYITNEINQSNGKNKYLLTNEDDIQNHLKNTGKHSLVLKQKQKDIDDNGAEYSYLRPKAGTPGYMVEQITESKPEQRARYLPIFGTPESYLGRKYVYEAPVSMKPVEVLNQNILPVNKSRQRTRPVDADYMISRGVTNHMPWEIPYGNLSPGQRNPDVKSNTPVQVVNPRLRQRQINEQIQNAMLSFAEGGPIQDALDVSRSLQDPELKRRATAMGWDTIEQYKNSGWKENTLKKAQEELRKKPIPKEFTADIPTRQDQLYGDNQSKASKVMHQAYGFLSDPMQAFEHYNKYGYVPQGNVGNYGIREGADAVQGTVNAFNPFSWGNAAYRLAGDLGNKKTYTTGHGAANAAWDALEALPLFAEMRGAAPTVARGLDEIGSYLTTQTPLKNAYKLRPNVLQENPEVLLYRAQPQEFDATASTINTLKNKLAAGEGTEAQRAIWKQYMRAYEEGNPNLVAQNDFYGKWFESDPNRLDWYLNSGDKYDVGTPMNILRTRIPASEAETFKVANVKSAQPISASMNTEFVLPQERIQSSEIFPESSLPDLIAQHNKFNTPHWWKGFSTPKELPTSPNMAVPEMPVVGVPTEAAPWQLKTLPGLHLESTVTNGPISKIVEPKTGLINVDQALAIIGKESGGKDKLEIIKSVLGDNIPAKMDYNNFRKLVQDALIPLEKRTVNYRSNYGIDRLGYPFPKRANVQLALDNSQQELARLTDELNKVNSQLDDINGFKESLKNDPSKAYLNNASNEQLTKYLQDIQENTKKSIDLQRKLVKRNSDLLSEVPLENETLLLSNKKGFGRGSDAHDNPLETLGHIHYYVDAENPTTAVMTQMQSDAFQGTHRVMPKSKEIAAKSLEYVENHHNALKAEYANAKLLPEGVYELPDGTKVSTDVYRDVMSTQSDMNDMLNAEVKNFTQKSLLDKKHQERFLQEFVQHASEKGMEKVRIPTSETSAKVQGYTPLSFDPTSPTAVAARNKVMEANRMYGPESEQFIKANAEYDALTKNAKPEYISEHKTILKKYDQMPKTIKKTFGVDVNIVTDSKGNTWYEFEIPKSFKEGKGEIKAFKQGGVLKFQDGGDMPFGLPLKEQNIYLLPEYNQPRNPKTGEILPDPQRPGLGMGTNATEYKYSYGDGDNEIQIPSIVAGQYIGDQALDRYKLTGERFKTMSNPRSYSNFYNTINELGLMQEQKGGTMKKVKINSLPKNWKNQ